MLIERDRPAPMHACTPGQVSRTKRSATLQLLSVKSGVLVVHNLLCARVHCVYEATMSALTGKVIRRRVGACDSVISWRFEAAPDWFIWQVQRSRDAIV